MKTTPTSTELPSGFSEELRTIYRSRSSIDFQTIIKSEVKSLTLRFTIRRDAYEDQSWGKAEVFTLNGWVDIFKINLYELPNTKEISYVRMPQDPQHSQYEEKKEIASELMMQDCLKMLDIALRIVGQRCIL